MCPLVEGGDSQPLVLVIDDNADSRELYRLYLVQNGCQVIEAADGLDGYRLAAVTS